MLGLKIVKGKQEIVIICPVTKEKIRIAALRGNVYIGIEAADDFDIARIDIVDNTPISTEETCEVES